MEKLQSKSSYILCLVVSIILNIYFTLNLYGDGDGDEGKLSWTKTAAIEAESVAATYCSGHGRAYLDGLVVDRDDEKPPCECSTCYGGPDCSQLDPACSANADGGDPLFLEPFWMQNAASSAVVVAGWHRMSYTFNDHTHISAQLENHICELHRVVGNAVTDGRYILFGTGSTQLLYAAVHALSPDNYSSPSGVVASIPFYPLYQLQTELYQAVNIKFMGDSSLWKNNSDTSTTMVEFVTSPNNPDGQLKEAVLHGQNVKVIHDLAYFWPHFTAIPAPNDGDIMLFTLSKLTGHAGSRFGWAVIKDKDIYERMKSYLFLNTMGVSRETQLRALKLLKVVLRERGRQIFGFGHETMKKRWQMLNDVVSMSTRFSLQKIPPHYCTFFQKFREPSPAYGWLKCEEEEDKDCFTVLQAANITPRRGGIFKSEDRYVRLSLVRSQDDFDLLIQRLTKLVTEEEIRSKTI